MKQLFLSLLFCISCFGQQQTAPSIVIFSGDPTGKVCSPSQIAVNSSNGYTCGCHAGVYAACGGSGGGGGDTITSPAGSIKVGGTSSNTTLDVVAASGASNYPLCSAISGGLPSSGICTVSVSAAQLLALNQLTNAVTLLPAQGANTIIIYDPALCAEFVCNSCTPFSSPDNFELYYGSGIGSSTAEQFGGSGFLDQSSSQYEEVPSPFWTSITLQPQQLTVAMLKNLPLLLGTATTSLTGCTSGTCGSLFITIPYTILRIE